MKLTAQIKLLPMPPQADALRCTLEAANAACTFISTVAWKTHTFNKFALQKLCYKQVRESFGLSAQLTIRVLAKVGDAYKPDKNTQRTFRPLASIAYDDRILSFALPKAAISIWTVAGRLSIPFVCGERQRQLLETRQGESDLVLRRGVWYLLVTCEVAEPEPQDVDDVLGVDMGMVNLAVDSDGIVHSGTQVEQQRQWYATRRKSLQAVGTKSAKRRLQKLRGRQRRFQTDTNHRISKRLVAKAEHTKRAIGVEDLTHIRQRTRVNGPVQRARQSNWAFGQLRAFIKYKAQRSGVMVLAIDPAYTSQRCNACGHTERANRHSREQFRCIVCGHTAPADYNAACNIRDRADVRRPMVSSPSG